MGADDSGEDLTVGEQNVAQDYTNLIGESEYDDDGVLIRPYRGDYVLGVAAEVNTGAQPPKSIHGVLSFGEYLGKGLQGSSEQGDGVFGYTRGDNTSGAVGRNDGNGAGVYGHSNKGTGVFGGSPTGDGVYGYARSSDRSGTVGWNDGAGVGVYGYGENGPGVYGESQTGDGMFGEARQPNQSGVVGKHLGGGYGVFGHSTDFAGVYGEGLVYGVYGWNNNEHGSGTYGQNDGKGPGTVGYSKDGQGVFGESLTGDGVYGYAQSDNHSGTAGWNDGNNYPSYGVYGNSENGVGVHGSSAIRTGVEAVSEHGSALVAQVGKRGISAGYFFGDVYIDGNLRVFGAKNAAVPQPDGSHRLLYCMESPESWFEDFGTARLVKGRAEVRLAADFALTIRTSEYHVFLTPYGDSKGLYVARSTPAGFTVREQGGGRSSIKFSFRVVARRKDVTVKRSQRVSLPTVGRPTIPRTMRERPKVKGLKTLNAVKKHLPVAPRLSKIVPTALQLPEAPKRFAPRRPLKSTGG
jgi:hypothetical protein